MKSVYPLYIIAVIHKSSIVAIIQSSNFAGYRYHSSSMEIVHTGISLYDMAKLAACNF